MSYVLMTGSRSESEVSERAAALSKSLRGCSGGNSSHDESSSPPSKKRGSSNTGPWVEATEAVVALVAAGIEAVGATSSEGSTALLLPLTSGLDVPVARRGGIWIIRYYLLTADHSAINFGPSQDPS